MSAEDDSQLSKIFYPGQRHGRTLEMVSKAEAASQVDAAFKAGYAAAFDGLIRTNDLAMVLSSFALMLQRKAEPTDDYWMTEARLFVSKMDASPHMTRWFPAWNAPRVLRPEAPVGFGASPPFLNTTVFGFLTQEHEDAEEAKRAKGVQG